LNTARRFVTQYIRHSPDVMRVNGVRQELIDDIGQTLSWPATPAQIERASRLIPDDVVQLVTAAGNAEDCRRKVREYIDAGATIPILYSLEDDVRLMIDVFADGYSN
jgi:hypothetical protein